MQHERQRYHCMLSHQIVVNLFGFFETNRIIVNPQAPVAQKVADEVVFRRFRGEGVEFF